MNNEQIKEAKAAGNSDWEILQMVIDTGVEYPDAVWKVSKALGMDAEQRQCMENDYDECC